MEAWKVFRRDTRTISTDVFRKSILPSGNAILAGWTDPVVDRSHRIAGCGGGISQYRDERRVRIGNCPRDRIVLRAATRLVCGGHRESHAGLRQ